MKLFPATISNRPGAPGRELTKQHSAFTPPCWSVLKPLVLAMSYPLLRAPESRFDSERDPRVPFLSSPSPSLPYGSARSPELAYQVPPMESSQAFSLSRRAVAIAMPLWARDDSDSSSGEKPVSNFLKSGVPGIIVGM